MVQLFILLITVGLYQHYPRNPPQSPASLSYTLSFLDYLCLFEPLPQVSATVPRLVILHFILPRLPLPLRTFASCIRLSPRLVILHFILPRLPLPHCTFPRGTLPHLFLNIIFLLFNLSPNDPPQPIPPNIYLFSYLCSI